MINVVLTHDVVSSAAVTKAPTRPDHGANNFDLIRLLAALQVAVGHAFYWLAVPLPRVVEEVLRSFPGVLIFFVISGFLITRSYMERNRGLLRYVVNRALRIYPALWAQYAAVIILMHATGGFVLGTLGNAHFWAWLGAAAFIGSNGWANLVTGFDPFLWEGLYRAYPADVLWTIPVELGFYVLVPVVFAPWFIRHRLVGAVVAASFITSLVLAYYSAPAVYGRGTVAMGLLHATAGPYFWIFLAGAAAALYWREISRFFEGRVLWWSLAYCAISEADWLIKGTLVFQYRSPDGLTVPRALILGGLVVSLAHSYPAISRWLRDVDLSYGLYLFHLPLMYGLHFAGFGGNIWLVVLCLLVALALAGLSWTFVEKPALSFKPGPVSTARAAAGDRSGKQSTDGRSFS